MKQVQVKKHCTEYSLKLLKDERQTMIWRQTLSASYVLLSFQIFRTNPRYILFIHLVVNDMILLITSIILFTVAYTFTKLHVPICCLIIIPAIITVHNTPLNITFMAAECYIAVCIPLRYNQICTVKKTYTAIGVIWTMGSLTILPDLFLSLASESVEFLTSRIFCERDRLFRSMYSIRKRDMTHRVFLAVVWVTLFYTYFRILLVARAADTEAKKARSTILTHGFQVLLSMLIYVESAIAPVILSMFPGYYTLMKVFFFIVNQVLPRCISPIVYGLRDKKFRKYFEKHLCLVKSRRKITATAPS